MRRRHPFVLLALIVGAICAQLAVGKPMNDRTMTSSPRWADQR